ncbi:hypothetical protein NDU88_002492 [Pleurodeles waltl]|uniref:Uncharacterized protein n=1 Tax=Pleurodeles waltl TaxID=8319 RepID=A0AAV7RDI7_PLEWA|nr:hypothetical protein NDU88_002492 [Pleurodeles waltl]
MRKVLPLLAPPVNPAIIGKEFLTDGGIKASVLASKTGFLTPRAASCTSEILRDAIPVCVPAEQLVLPLPRFHWRGTRDANRRLLRKFRTAQNQLATPESSAFHKRLPALMRFHSKRSRRPNLGSFTIIQSS